MYILSFTTLLTVKIIKFRQRKDVDIDLDLEETVFRFDVYGLVLPAEIQKLTQPLVVLFQSISLQSSHKDIEDVIV